MLESLSPAMGNAVIAAAAAVLFVIFWRSSTGVRAIDTVLIRMCLAFLLLPFVVAGVLGALGKHPPIESRPGSSRPATETAAGPPPQPSPAPVAQKQAPTQPSSQASLPAAKTASVPPPAPPQTTVPVSPAPAPVVVAPASAPPAPVSPPVAAAPPPPAPVAAPAPAPATAPATAPAPPPAVAAPPATRAPDAAAPSPAPAAAEATAAPASNEPWDIVPVYFGTDRKTEGISERIAFGSDRARQLQLGRALVTVPKIHEVPNVERPWVYRLPFTRIVIYEEKEDPARHFTLKELRGLSREEMAKLVRDRLSASRDFKDHALLFVHGFNTTFEAALYRTAQIAYDLKFDGAPFLYSWPSKGQIGFQDYSYDRESAGQAEPYLRELVDFIARESGAKSLSIIAHSMGNQVLLPVLRELKRTPPSGIEISQIILAAPDVDRDTFEFLAREINGVGRGVTMLAASNDRALMASRRFWGGVARAGDVPEQGPVVVPGIDTIDVTAVSTEILSLNHSGYAQKQQVLDDIRRLLMTGTRPPDKRFDTLRRVTTEKGDFWRFP